MFNCVIALSLLGSTQLAAGTKPTGIVTILEGKASVIRALSRFDALEGIGLLSGDLLRTDKDSFLRIEYQDETWIELGPETLLRLTHPAAKRANRPGLYLLSGWLKLGCGKAESGGTRSLASTGMDLIDVSGVIVVRANEASHAIFAEDGTARWIDRVALDRVAHDRTAQETEPITLHAHDFLVAGPQMPAKLQARPTADFIGALPPAYRDTLPLRYGLFNSRSVVPKDLRPFSYADVEPWIDAEPAMRRQFVFLWRAKARDAAFRTALNRDLASHPEWDPVLHPERYETNAHTGSGLANPPVAPIAQGH